MAKQVLVHPKSHQRLGKYVWEKRMAVFNERVGFGWNRKTPGESFHIFILYSPVPAANTPDC